MFDIRLHRARKAAGLSLRDLGEIIGVSHAAIKKYEDGLSMPSSDILIKLSRALKVRSEYFFRPELISLKSIEYRKSNSLSKKRLSTIEHQVIDQVERRMELENLFPQIPIKPFTPIEEIQITSLDQIEQAAECVREIWKLGFNPIPDLIDVLETNGIRVFTIEVDAKDKFDGLAAQINRDTPVIVVSSHWPGDRQRFTLAHELGHLMLESRLANNICEEEACNRFAGAFLFPRDSVLQNLGKHRNAIELKELELLKEEFGLSMASILYRARDLEIISYPYHKELTKTFRNKGWDRKEPGTEYPTEKAHLFEQLIFHALAETYISESKAAELMGVSSRHFHRIRSMEGSNAAINQ